MKVITLESEACKSLVRKIYRIARYIKNRERRKAVLSEVWVSTPNAAAILRVSRRTIQRLRNKGKRTCLIRGSKSWHTLTEVERLLPGRVVRTDNGKGGKP